MHLQRAVLVINDAEHIDIKQADERLAHASSVLFHRDSQADGVENHQPCGVPVPHPRILTPRSFPKSRITYQLTLECMLLEPPINFRGTAGERREIVLITTLGQNRLQPRHRFVKSTV